MPQQPLPHQYTIVLSPEVELTTLPEAIERAGGKITQRLGRRAIVIRTDKTEADLAQLLPPGTRLLRSQDPVPDGLSASEAIQLRASRVRQSAKFREAKRNRPHEGREWGTGDLPAPDVDDEPELTGGQIALADEDDAIVLPTNERLINDVAVGVVIVNGHGPYAISDEEKANIVAEIQEGVGWLGDQEPDANVSWSLDVKEVTVDITPWQGARWPGMPESFFKGMDAALMRQDNGKIYFFKGDQYVRFSNVNDGVDAGYPRPIADGWSGMPAGFQAGIDAALWRESNGKIYFFKGNQYVRFSNVSDGMDAGYPKLISESWPGLPLSFQEGIDAALLRKDNGKIYFFKGDQYVRFSSVAAGVDAGYPKPIAGNWKGLPETFQAGIDAALWRNSNDAVYFFKKGRLWGRYVRMTKVEDGVDPAYVDGVPIGLSTIEAELLWRDPTMTALGFAKGDEGVKQYIASLPPELGTEWAYCGFFTKQPTTWLGYAGGGRIVIRRDEFELDGSTDRIMAHETGHIFGAPDEYASSNCSCGAVKGKFFQQPNDNCANCTPDAGDPCIMRGNSPAMCPNTPWHLGWGAFITRIDAALWRQDNSKIYLFSNNKYIRITDVSAGRDEGYPKNISAGWSGLPAGFRQGIDAALWRQDNGKIYFFKGDQYVRISDVGDGVDAGYPKPIAGNWPGLPASFQAGIDAAFCRESNGKIYFFKGSQYVRFSNVSDGVDAGYPRTIGGNWNGLPASFHSGIDAVLMRHDNDKIYFFKGKRYVRYSDPDNTADAGYPRYINKNWIPFPQ